MPGLVPIEADRINQAFNLAEPVSRAESTGRSRAPEQPGKKPRAVARRHRVCAESIVAMST